MTTGTDLSRWANALRRSARKTLGDDLGAADWGTSAIGGFSDEMGHRRAVDPYLLAWRGKQEATPPASAHPATPEALLWAALTDESIDVRAVLGDRLDRLGSPTDDPAGSLFPQPDDVVIEVWSETELASLHALWWHAAVRADEDIAALIPEVAAWHVERMQPDNATNHPWAVHVFVELESADKVPGAALYAQTLLHNCMVSLGRPDRFSAHILADAATALEHASA